MNEQIAHYQSKLNYEWDSADLFECLEERKLIVVIDTRKSFAFDQEHIPGAKNLPHREMTEENTKDLSREALYICYCDGIGCNASTKGALNMTKLGFRVRELIGGLDWWKRDGYATQGDQSTEGHSIQCAC